MPPFMAREDPALLPMVAPVPAPTLPSATGAVDAACAARYPQSAVGLIFGLAPTFRSMRLAAGTMGTLIVPYALNPMFFSSRYRMMPDRLSRPNALPPDRLIA